jgi:ParB family chromosome partitioning protein
MYPDDKDEVVQIYLDDIIPNRFQPREVFDEKALKELAVSIKEHGVIQPIIVRNVNGKYEIIAGERRYKASALAGLTKIPAIIRDLDDKESSKVALLENLQRKNLNPIEEARTYQKILELDQMTQEELAKTMGKSQSAVANKIRLLSLSDDVQNALLKEEISERHARALINIPDAKKQKEMLKKVIADKMSVRVLEEEIKKMYPKEGEEPISLEAPKEPQEEVVASANTFINTNPLTPTASMPEDESNYGKIVIAPPEGDTEMPATNKFINYGEIGKEEDTEEEDENFAAPTVAVNVNEVKETAQDINTDNGGGTSLDNLLNIGNPTLSTPSTEYITPAEKIVKGEDMDEDEEETVSDYFKMPEQFTSLEINPTISNPINEAPEKETYTVDEAVTEIKNLIDKLKEKGIKIDTNEMNFDKSYQMIIKIDKETKVDE